MHPHTAELSYSNESTFCVQSANQFEMFSFIRSKDIAWAQKCRNRSRDSDQAHLGTGLVIRRLILHAVNSCTEFEVSSFSRCRDISGGVKF